MNTLTEGVCKTHVKGHRASSNYQKAARLRGAKDVERTPHLLFLHVENCSVSIFHTLQRINCITFR